MPGATFSHPTNSQIGSLTIGTGLDQCSWAYNLNTAVFPTYGGEVVQILAVYIDDVTIGGTVTTYSQAEAIYSYFANYMQLATQGYTPNSGSYVATPLTFTYPSRNWTFPIYPKTAPGFAYSYDTVAPTWSITAHVEDNAVNLKPIKNAISATVASQLTEFQSKNFNDEISPSSGDPSTDPFQTYNGNVSTGLQNTGSYYNSLVTAYSQGNYESLTGGAPDSTSPIGNSGSGSGTAASNSTTPTGKTGSITVKGNPANSGQLTNIKLICQAIKETNAPRLAALAILCAAMGEDSITNQPSIGVFSILSASSYPGDRNDVLGTSKYWLTHGFYSPPGVDTSGGGIGTAKRYPDKSPLWIADAIEGPTSTPGSGAGSYESEAGSSGWPAEAANMLAVFGA